MKIKCLIVDLDDTLVDDTENRRGAFIHILNVFNIPYSEELFQKWLKFDNYYWKEYAKTIDVPKEYNQNGKDASEYLRGMRFLLFFSHCSYDPLTMQNIFKEGLKDRIVEIPGATAAIQLLAKKYPIYISTSGDSEIAKEKIKRINLENSIQKIFSVDMTQPPAVKSDLEFIVKFFPL